MSEVKGLQGKTAGPFQTLYNEFKAGKMTRQEFLAKSRELGVGAPVALFVASQTTTPPTPDGQGEGEGG